MSKEPSDIGGSARPLTHLLDTDHLHFLLLGGGSEHDALVARLAGGGVGWAVSVIGVQERLAGLFAMTNGRPPSPRVRLGYDLLRRSVRFFGAAPVLPFDDAAAAEFDRLDAAAKAVNRKPVPTLDLRVAAITSAHGLTLLTRNAKDFARVPGLRFEDGTA